jgi:hypothetical protein
MVKVLPYCAQKKENPIDHPIFQVHKSDDFFAPKQSFFPFLYKKISQNAINSTPIFILLD